MDFPFKHHSGLNQVGNWKWITQILLSSFNFSIPILPLCDNHRNAFQDDFGAEYLASLSFLPAQPAGQLLHIKFIQMIDEGTLNRKSTSANDG